MGMLEGDAQAADGDGDPVARWRRTAGFALIGLAVVALAVISFDVLMLAFTGILFAVFLCAISGFLECHLRLNHGLSLALTCMLLAGVVIGGSLWMAPSVAEQADQLAKRLPESWAQVSGQLERSGWGRWLIQRATPADQVNGGLTKAAGFLGNALGIIVNVLVVGFIGLFIAAQPRVYRRGLLRLAPPHRRARLGAVLDETGFELRWWLLGQAIGMVVVGGLTTIGLWLFGVPLALILGVIAGVLNFVPNIGPWIAAVPGVLIAFTVKPSLALPVAGVYLAVQVLESYVLMPLIQRRTIDLPPALTIFAQVLMGVLVGAVGVMLAAPLLVLVVVLVKMLYIEDTLGDHVELPGERSAAVPDQPRAPVS